jgi:phosphatidylcholine synthase
MTTRTDERQATVAVRTAGFGVHLLTASGAALGLLALLAAVERQWALMFLWLGIALIVDAIDGALARRLAVARTLPRWSGDVLDLVVDILTYVFVPAFAILAGGILPEPIAIPTGLLIVVTGTLYFADTRMKSVDNYFLGFPAVWNAVAFYVFLLRPPPWLAALVVLILAVATFVPLPFVHPFRVRRLRLLNAGLLAGWTVLAALALWHDLAPAAWVSVGLAAIGLYFLCAGLFRRVAPI